MDEGHRAGQQAQELAEKTSRPLKAIIQRSLRMLLLAIAANAKYLATHLTGKKTYKRMLTHGSPVKLLDRDIKQTDIPILRQVIAENFNSKMADEIVFATRNRNDDMKAMSGLKVMAGGFWAGRKRWVENFLLAHDGLPDPKMADCRARDDERIPEDVGVFISDRDLAKFAPDGMSVNDFRKQIMDAFESRVEARQCAYYRTKKGENFDEALKDEEMNSHVSEESKEGYVKPDIKDMNFYTAPRTNIGPLHEDELDEMVKTGGRGAITVDGETYKKYLEKAFDARGLKNYAAVTEHGTGKVVICMAPDEHQKYLDAIEEIKNSSVNKDAFEIYNDRIFLGKNFPKKNSITCFVSAEDAQKLANMAKERGLPISMSRRRGGYSVTMASEDAMLKEFAAYTKAQGENRRKSPEKETPEKDLGARDMDTVEQVTDYCRNENINGIAFIDSDRLAGDMIKTFKDDIPAFRNVTPENLDRITMSREDAEKVSDYLMESSDAPALFSPGEIRGKDDRFTMAFFKSAELVKEKSHFFEKDIEF